MLTSIITIDRQLAGCYDTATDACTGSPGRCITNPTPTPSGFWKLSNVQTDDGGVLGSYGGVCPPTPPDPATLPAVTEVVEFVPGVRGDRAGEPGRDAAVGVVAELHHGQGAGGSATPVVHAPFEQLVPQIIVREWTPVPLHEYSVSVLASVHASGS